MEVDYTMKQYSDNNIKIPRFNEESGFYTTKARSELMRKIKNTETKPEQKLRKFIWGLGIRYRKNVKSMPGNPDIVISKHRIVIFVDGEFWHGYNWQEKKLKLKANRDYWIPKIERNIQRDNSINSYYKENGWKVIRLWEHQVNRELSACLNILLHSIEGDKIDNSY